MYPVSKPAPSILSLLPSIPTNPNRLITATTDQILATNHLNETRNRRIKVKNQTPREAIADPRYRLPSRHRRLFHEAMDQPLSSVTPSCAGKGRSTVDCEQLCQRSTVLFCLSRSRVRSRYTDQSQKAARKRGCPLAALSIQRPQFDTRH